MGMWDVRRIKTMKEFCECVRWHASKDTLLMEYRPKDVSTKIVDAFKRAFPWHYNDTQRSYTQAKLRKSGNRGKSTDFAYMNRAAKFAFPQPTKPDITDNKAITTIFLINSSNHTHEHGPYQALIVY
jgi:hypothetical protein